MTVYIVAQLRFKDLPAYRRYQQRFGDVFARHPGQLLAADEQPEVMEGEGGVDKVVLMAFPDRAAALAFARDPAYEAISVDRHIGAVTSSLLVRGLPPPA